MICRVCHTPFVGKGTRLCQGCSTMNNRYYNLRSKLKAGVGLSDAQWTDFKLLAQALKKDPHIV